MNKKFLQAELKFSDPNTSLLFPSSLSSLVKSADTGNGVTFRSGDNVDLGQSHIGVSFIDTAMQMVRPDCTLTSRNVSLKHKQIYFYQSLFFVAPLLCVERHIDIKTKIH